jgi:hypothetical protein
MESRYFREQEIPVTLTSGGANDSEWDPVTAISYGDAPAIIRLSTQNNQPTDSTELAGTATLLFRREYKHLINALEVGDIVTIQGTDFRVSSVDARASFTSDWDLRVEVTKQ